MVAFAQEPINIRQYFLNDIETSFILQDDKSQCSYPQLTQKYIIREFYLIMIKKKCNNDYLGRPMKAINTSII